MPLRRLTISIELNDSNQHGELLKREHARLLRSVTRLLETHGWGQFDVPLHDSQGSQVGFALLSDGRRITTTLHERKAADNGDSEQAAA